MEMNCSTCHAPLEKNMQFCLKCGTKVIAGGVGAEHQAMPPPLPKKKKAMSTGCLVALILASVLAVPVMGIVAAALFPAISNARLQANATAMQSRARDIYVGIISANSEREPLGLESAWPKSGPTSATKEEDTLGQPFQTSTAYFKALYDESHAGTDKWMPPVIGFDYSKVAGAGVLPCTDQKLTADHNAWAVAANIMDQDNDIIPVLITRNVDVRLIERAVNKGLRSSEFSTRIDMGTGMFSSPLGRHAGVVIRKGGAGFIMRFRTATLGALFNYQELPPRDPSKPPIVYLMP